MTGNEGPRIAGREDPNSWEHWSIFRAFNPLDTTEADNAKSEYTKLASDWSAAVETFAARIRRSSTSAWEGAAATASQNAIADYATRALDLTPALNSLAQRVSTTVDGVNKTRQGVDEPQNRPDSMWNLDGYDFIGLEPGSRSMTAINDARDKAREAMSNHYVNQFVAVDGQIPVLPQPENPTSPLTTWKPTSGNSSDDGDGDGDGNGGGTKPAGADTGNPTEENPATTEDPAANETPTDTDDSSDDDNAEDTIPATTEEPGSTTPATTPSTTPSGITPSGTPGAGSPGAGSPGGGSPGGSGVPTSGAPGAVTPGSPAAAKVPTGATAGAGGSGTGRAGMPGMGGMGGGRGGGKSEEDESHQIPDWLKNMENTEELLGDMPRVIQGGVIGGNADE